jgi:hypothetical protein
MAAEFVEPVRYVEEEDAPAETSRQYVGFRRWVVVVCMFGASYYMHSIEAIAYSTLLFLCGVVVIIGLTIHLMITKPRVKDEKQERRQNLLERWSK